MSRALLLWLGLCVAGLAQAAPPDFRAEYEVLRDGSALGEASLSFQRQGQQAEFVTRTRGTAGLAALAGIDIEERSQLRWTRNQPETIRYSYRQKAALGKGRDRRVEVSPQGIVSTDRERRYEFPYRPGVLDRHAVTIALMQALFAGQRGELRFTVVDRDELEEQRYRVAGEERLETPQGLRRALRVERLRESGNARRTSIWFDIERGYLPLRILDVDRKGEQLDLRIRR